jgi:hypothetical protein
MEYTEKSTYDLKQVKSIWLKAGVDEQLLV